MATTVTVNDAGNEISVAVAANGSPGAGVPTGGATGTYLKKSSATDYDTEWGLTAESDHTDSDNYGAIVTSDANGLVKAQSMQAADSLVIGLAPNVSTIAPPGAPGGTVTAPTGTGIGALTSRTDGKILETIVVVMSDVTTALTASTTVPKVSMRAPFAMTLTDVRADVRTAPTGAALIVDIHDSGTTIMTTNKITIDDGEYSSDDATTQPALTDTAIADNAILTFFVDQIGSTVAGAGLKVTLTGYRT